MTNQLSNKQKCLVMRNGIEIWLDGDKANKIGNDMLVIPRGIFKAEDRFLNTADIIGIFTPEDMDNLTRRKNGQWKCEKRGRWHDRGIKCECLTIEQEEIKRKNTEEHQRLYGSYPAY